MPLPVLPAGRIHGAGDRSGVYPSGEDLGLPAAGPGYDARSGAHGGDGTAGSHGLRYPARGARSFAKCGSSGAEERGSSRCSPTIPTICRPISKLSPGLQWVPTGDSCTSMASAMANSRPRSPFVRFASTRIRSRPSSIGSGLAVSRSLTKPGTDKYRGQVFFEFGDSALNARNPFAITKPSYQSRQFQGNLSGPIVSKKASFFLDFSYRHQEEQALINALTLDPASLQPLRLQENVPTPNDRTSISPRIDYQLTPNITLQGRYAWTQHDTGEQRSW